MLNERTKLFANTLDRLATVCVTVGVLTPLANALAGLQFDPAKAISMAWIAYLFVAAAVSLHLLAQLALGGMR